MAWHQAAQHQGQQQQYGSENGVAAANVSETAAGFGMACRKRRRHARSSVCASGVKQWRGAKAAWRHGVKGEIIGGVATNP